MCEPTVINMTDACTYCAAQRDQVRQASEEDLPYKCVAGLYGICSAGHDLGQGKAWGRFHVSGCLWKHYYF